MKKTEEMLKAMDIFNIVLNSKDGFMQSPEFVDSCNKFFPLIKDQKFDFEDESYVSTFVVCLCSGYLANNFNGVCEFIENNYRKIEYPPEQWSKRLLATGVDIIVSLALRENKPSGLDESQRLREQQRMYEEKYVYLLPPEKIWCEVTKVVSLYLFLSVVERMLKYRLNQIDTLNYLTEIDRNCSSAIHIVPVVELEEMYFWVKLFGHKLVEEKEVKNGSL